MGVAKSYITRVGEGYFPTEIFGNEAEELRKLGWEYGATTGRPRRVGYFDIPMLRKSAKLNGFDYIALTKVDVLGKFKKIKVAISYEVNGSEVKEYDPLLKVDKVNYEEFKPWDDNPNNLEKFIDFIESEIKIPIPIVGNGEDRDKIIVREKIY
jgi:adenylosuccinate synthase